MKSNLSLLNKLLKKIRNYSLITFSLYCFTCSTLATEIIETDKKQVAKKQSVLDTRVNSIQSATSNPFAISQHKQNYLMPFSYVSKPSPDNVKGLEGNIDPIEAKYQISVKFPLYLTTKDASGVYFGFTAKSFWQVYNREVSKPFRETNYEPEVFYSWFNQISILGFKFNQLQLGLNHQSNGKSNEFSRSWNRLYAAATFSDLDSFYYLRAWYRLPEEKKETPTSTTGDDNPDITDYLGNVELGYGTYINKVKLTGTIRNNLNLSDNKGSLELNVSYPISQRYELVAQYFNGYGDSLIDYNQHQQRFSIGMQLTFF
ncbi:phospholipase A [Paraglaciecola aquimarina]|uniref:Phospholipase A1 n=1 Tax=Paraglaciecola algarum TaxID=3050085 RepID=A0ABS9D4I8_9ALTE|nr:phospholipase A [Paraglaciecola sp. G1-23]MCF2947834.1 phospholipase A [Paraglaciecola sp. G1-23]